jgi:hypothetical protein
VQQHPTITDLVHCLWCLMMMNLNFTRCHPVLHTTIGYIPVYNINPAPRHWGTGLLLIPALWFGTRIHRTPIGCLDLLLILVLPHRLTPPAPVPRGRRYGGGGCAGAAHLLTPWPPGDVQDQQLTHKHDQHLHGRGAPRPTLGELSIPYPFRRLCLNDSTNISFD